jgi:hypothetical protein
LGGHLLIEGFAVFDGHPSDVLKDILFCVGRWCCGRCFSFAGLFFLFVFVDYRCSDLGLVLDILPLGAVGSVGAFSFVLALFGACVLVFDSRNIFLLS